MSLTVKKITKKENITDFIGLQYRPSFFFSLSYFFYLS